jgi:uncharacterized membrane protein
MLKILNYLYYKFYRATLVGSLNDIAEFAAMIYLSTLFFLNLLVIGGLLRKVDLLPVFFTGKKQVVIFMVCLFLISYFLFLKGKKYKKIIAEYEQESESQRKRGNLIVWLYVIISLAMVFVGAFYKPGKL